MKRARDDSLAHAVATRVRKAGGDRLWTYADFPGVSRTALAAALSRLAKAGELTRVRRGVYYRPGKTLFGMSTPDPEALADAVLRARGEAPLPAGVGAFNRLGLTTQVPGAVTRATRRSAAPADLGSVRLYTTPRPLDAQKGIRPEERAALEALRKITRIPDTRPRYVLERIGMLVRQGELDFVRLARFARAEPPRVRALLGALGEELRHGNVDMRVPTEVLEELRESLNPLTSFTVRGAREALPHAAAAWRIR
ncbi:MAG TPA: DUF6088 family protein [Gemmatimonadaceae bacterium]|nr:DUF6088 family protein [Gemmatimonadaceae bacterium]